MTHLKKVELVNFQKHKNLTVKFDPKITTIVGETESGKSAIIRALYWLMLNDPPKGRYIRFGKSKCSVALTVGKDRIVRLRSDKSNLYKINGKVFRSFKRLPPDDVSKLLNISESNFQKQLDLHFWFSDTPGQVSRNLNEIVNLGIIDSTLANLASEMRRANGKLADTKERYQTARANKKELSWIPECVKAGKEILALEKEKDDNAIAVRSLTLSLREATRHNNTRKVAATAIDHGKKLLETGQRATRQSQQVTELTALLETIRVAKADKNREVPDLTPLLEFRRRADAVAEERRELEFFLNELILGEEQCHLLQTQLTNAQSLFQRVVGSSKKVRCPTCGRLVKRTSLRRRLATATSLTTRPSIDLPNLIGTKLKTGI